MIPIRIMIADDHAIVREGLRGVLTSEEGFIIVGLAGDGEQAVQMAAQTHPDVILMDFAMPKLDGFESAKQIKAQLPGVVIIMFTGFDCGPHIATALECGVTGFLSKALPPDELILGIKAAHAGQSILINVGIVGQRPNGLWGAILAGASPSPLTPQENNILKLVARGMGNKNIATETGLNERTVQTHLENIFRKFNVNTRTEAVVRALKIRVLSLEDLP